MVVNGCKPTAMKIFQYLIAGVALLSKNQPQEKGGQAEVGECLARHPKVSCRDDHRQPDDQVKYSFALLMDSMC